MRRGLFERRRREVPRLNTASLPDLIFTVLFFFMIVTHMRDVDPLVSYRLPQGTQVQKTQHKSATCHIYIGRPTGDTAADSLTADGGFCIQLNNRLATIDDINSFVEAERAAMNADDQARMTVSIRADRDVPMGIIADVKQALQRSFALKINYSASEAAGGDKKK